MSFLDHFESVRSCGNGSGQWMAKCQAHEDRNHSLCIGRGDGKWLLFCQAGCWVGQVLACHGLDWNDLFDEDCERNSNGRVNLGRVRDERRPRLDMSGEALLPPQHIIDLWAEQLSDPIRNRLYELKGWTPRTLKTLHVGWDGARLTVPVYNRSSDTGIFRLGVGSLVRYLPNGEPKSLAVGPRLLYLTDSKLREDVWLVEGEPDAISGRELELSTVAIPGVGKRNAEWLLRFKNRRVTICFDCDAPGRQAAREWARGLDGVGVENRVVDLAPGVDDGYDIGDALANATKTGRVPELKAYLANLHAEAWTA